MAKPTRTYTEPKKLDRKANEQRVLQRIHDLAGSGMSKRSIAVKLGLTLDEFQTALEIVERGIRPYQLAYDTGRANFEEDNVEIIEALLYDPDTSKGLKAKIARENLKTLEEWSPATRAVKVQLEAGPAEFIFEEFTQAELEQIAADSAEHDKGVDAEENNPED